MYRGISFNGQGVLKSTFVPKVPDARNLNFSFGRTAVAPTRRTNENFDEVYRRFYILHETRGIRNAHKLTRAMIFSGADWSQTAIGHLWDNSVLGRNRSCIWGFR